MQNVNNFQQFHSQEFGSLDILMIEDRPYFPATECAKALGYRNPHKAVADHCPHLTKREVGVKTGEKADGAAAYQNVSVNYIPEGDLYRLIIRSKLPAAERFEKWVFDEVLPTIRKYGAYISTETLEEMLHSRQFTDKLLSDLKAEREKSAVLKEDIAELKEDNAALSEKNERWEQTCMLLEEKGALLEELTDELAPKALYCELILRSDKALPISIIAKDYGMTAASFNKMLHDFGIQYKVRDTWLLYQKYVRKGYTNSYTYWLNPETSVIHTCWTQKGRLFLYEFLKGYGIRPLVETEYSAA